MGKASNKIQYPLIIFKKEKFYLTFVLIKETSTH